MSKALSEMTIDELEKAYVDAPDVRGESVVFGEILRRLQQAGEHDEIGYRPEYYGGEANPFEPFKIIEHYDLPYHVGDALAYMIRTSTRPGEDDGVRDLEKAVTHLNAEIRYRKRRAEKA